MSNKRTTRNTQPRGSRVTDSRKGAQTPSSPSTGRYPTWVRIAAGIFAVALLAALFATAFVGGGDDGETSPPTTQTPTETIVPTTSILATATFEYGAGDCAPAEVPEPAVIDFDAAPQLCIDPAASYVAVFDTSEGEIRVDLDVGERPGTVNNFVTLAGFGYYDGTELFRTNTGIEIVQGGSPHTNNAGDQGPGYQLLDEGDGFYLEDFAGQQVLYGPYSYSPGQLVMARTPSPNGASAQFFFTTGPASSLLDAGQGPGSGTYVPVGSTDASGLDTLAAIMALHEDTVSPGEGAPTDTVTIISVRIEEN